MSEFRTTDPPAWMQRQIASGAMLTRGVPGARLENVKQWLGDRWFWWPQGIPDGRWVGFASSRLGKKIDERESWFTVLRAACSKIEPDQELLVAAQATSSAPFVERAARLFERRLLQISVSDDRWTWERWFAELEKQPPPSSSDAVFPVHISPPIHADVATEQPLSALANTPVQDRALVALSDRLLVSHVRSGGQLHELLRLRLRCAAWPVASVQVAVGDGHVSSSLRDELLGMGAIGWYLYSQTTEEPDAALIDAGTAELNGRVIELPASTCWSFLTHCTRRRFGPWPDETETDYLDSLVLSQPAARRSPLDALLRIVTQQRLIASSDANRGGHPVVSFSAVPLGELTELRTFRAHRSRWDFEPYGICIQQAWLAQLGSRPVLYGDEHVWNQLAANDRPFFQKQFGTRSESPIDWSVEKEWRHLGDLDLSQLPAAAAFLFTPTLAEATRLAAVSRWPVTVLTG